MKFISRARQHNRFLGVILLLIGALVLSGCSALVLPEGWAGIKADGNLIDGRYDGRYIYVAYRNFVFRIDTQTGANGDPIQGERPDRLIDWAAKAPGPMFAPPALSEDGTLYIGSYNHSLYAFSPTADPRTKEISTFQPTPGTDRIIGGAVVYKGRVYVGHGNKGIKAYDVRTGALLASFENTRSGIWATPVIDPATNILYVGSLGHSLYALNADDLSYIWELDLGGGIGAAPLLHEGYLYVGTFGNELLKIAPENPPQIEARFKTDGWIWSTPVVKDGVLFFGDLKGYLYAVEAGDLTQKWKVNDQEHPGGIRGKVVVVDGKVIAGSESKYLRAYDEQTGAPIWTSGLPSEDRILGDLIVMGDDVIVTTLSENQIVLAHSVTTGSRRWSVRQPNDDTINVLTRTPPAQ